MEYPLLELATEAIEHFREIKSKHPTLLAEHSLPILLSGNIDEYSRSRLKVVTVALNPSSNEFDGPNHRYRINQLVPQKLLNACSAYFDVGSIGDVSSWFLNYEKVLNGLESSYIFGHLNRAIHTDLCSPLVTKEKWRGLRADDQRLLENFGIPFWTKLVGTLNPDIILMSIAKEYRSKVCSSWSDVFVSKDGERQRSIAFGQVGKSLIAWGRARNLPFMDFADNEKAHVGEVILRHKLGPRQ